MASEDYFRGGEGLVPEGNRLRQARLGGGMSLSDEELATLFLSPSRLRTLTDEDLMQALRMGCNDAPAILFGRHRALVFRIARAILHSDGEVEETVTRVSSDVFKAARIHSQPSNQASQQESSKGWAMSQRF